MTLYFVTTFRLHRKKILTGDSFSNEEPTDSDANVKDLIEYWHSLPKRTKTVWKVKNSRTPVFFDNIEDAKTFVANNLCDWEECGYYNMALIQPLESNRCYPDANWEDCLLYSSDEGWLDIKEGNDFNHYIIYKNLEIVDYIGVEIG